RSACPAWNPMPPSREAPLSVSHGIGTYYAGIDPVDIEVVTHTLTTLISHLSLCYRTITLF
ncbi:MAG: hypothetical protein ACRC9M_07345, partial [Aeromonas sp.]